MAALRLARPGLHHILPRLTLFQTPSKYYANLFINSELKQNKQNANFLMRNTNVSLFLPQGKLWIIKDKYEIGEEDEACEDGGDAEC